MGKAQEFRQRAQAALRDPGMNINNAWTRDLPASHRLIENEDVIAISTKGARAHATEQEALDMAARLLSGEWGNVRFTEDREQNDANLKRDRGMIMGIYTAKDGTELWVMQSHRFVPPTVMLPEER